MYDERIADALAREPDVLFAYVYGSENPETDLDIALYLRETPSDLLHATVKWADRLQEVVDPPVDPFILNDGPLEWTYAAQKGRLVFERDPAARIEFEVRTQREYWDWVPKLRILLDAALRSLRTMAHGSGRG
ncbi:MAG: nucleotidyltransferase domain-containing protein [Nitrospirae bacterium]|nr:nucleotidyltransferase domain-containing protein [Nitrospirota bacterium]